MSSSSSDNDNNNKSSTTSSVHDDFSTPAHDDTSSFSSFAARLVGYSRAAARPIKSLMFRNRVNFSNRVKFAFVKSSFSRWPKNFFFSKIASRSVLMKSSATTSKLSKFLGPLAIELSGSTLLTAAFISADIAYTVYDENKYHHHHHPISQDDEEKSSENHQSSSQFHNNNNSSLVAVAEERLVFHAFATVILPMVFVEGVTHVSSHFIFPKIWKPTLNFRNANINKFGPSLLALSFVPFFPVIIDEPVEFVVKKMFVTPSSK